MSQTGVLCLWQDAELAATYSGMASAFDRQGDDEQALEHWRKAVAIEIKALGPEDVGVARTYSKMAVACEQQGEDEEALEVRLLTFFLAGLRCSHYRPALPAPQQGAGDQAQGARAVPPRRRPDPRQHGQRL